MQPADLPTFFEHQRDPAAVCMAAFSAKEPENLASIRVLEKCGFRLVSQGGFANTRACKIPEVLMELDA